MHPWPMVPMVKELEGFGNLVSRSDPVDDQMGFPLASGRRSRVERLGSVFATLIGEYA